MDAFQLKKASVDMERNRIQTAVRLIQRHPKFKNVPIIHIPENAPGSAGPHLHEHLRNFPNVFTMEEYGSKKSDGGTLGVPATDRNQQTYQMSMMLSTQALHYSENAMTYPGQQLNPIKDKFEFQLLCWERVVEWDPAKPLSKVKEKWGAKHAAGNDDLAVCGLMLMEWPQRFFQNPKYGDVIRRFISPSYQQRTGLGNRDNFDLGADLSLPKAPGSQPPQLPNTAYSRYRQPNLNTFGGGPPRPATVNSSTYKPHVANFGAPTSIKKRPLDAASASSSLASGPGRPSLSKVPRFAAAK